MTQSTTNPSRFEAALAFWNAWSNKDVEAAGHAAAFQAAEETLLLHEAETLDEAAIQLSVVIDSMIGGGRSDGMDVKVVRRAQILMRQASGSAASSGSSAQVYA